MATFAVPIATLSPMNVTSLLCDGFQLGPCAVSVDSQGGHQLLVASIVGNIVVNPNIAALTDPQQALVFTVPDGLLSGTATVTDLGSTSATFSLRVVSQYVQAYEYSGEGTDTASLAPGELDVILKRASQYCDAWMGGTRRIMQVLEDHYYSGVTRRLYPFHKPLVSLDGLQFVTAANLRTTFNTTTDVYINTTDGYVDILAFSFGNYILLGMIETLGFSANVIELLVTVGYPALQTPMRLQEAVIMVATRLITERRMNKFGLGGLQTIRNGLIGRDPKPFDIPAPAKALLRPLVQVVIR